MSDGSQPIVKAMDGWFINVPAFRDLQKDPKGREVGAVKLQGLRVLMIKIFRLQRSGVKSESVS